MSDQPDGYAAASGPQKMTDPYRLRTTLVCETCETVVNATLARQCWICVAEDEDIKAAERVLNRVKATVEEARQRRRAGSNAEAHTAQPESVS